LDVRETMVCKECEIRVKVLGGLKLNTVGGAKFGSRLWEEPKIMDEVSPTPRG